MSDNNDWYLESTPKPSMRVWIFQQMAMGATYAALVLFGIIALILMIRAFSYLLPEDPYAVLEVGSRVINAIA